MALKYMIFFVPTNARGRKTHFENSPTYGAELSKPADSSPRDEQNFRNLRKVPSSNERNFRNLRIVPPSDERNFRNLRIVPPVMSGTFGTCG